MYFVTSATLDWLTEKPAYPACHVNSTFPALAGLHPFRAALLHLFDDLLQGVVFRQRKQGVDVIFHAADDQRGTFPLFEDARLIGPKVLANVSGNPCLPVFRAVDEMDQVLDQGL